MPLPRPCLMLVTDRSLCGGADGLADAVEAAVEGGADAVQLPEDAPPVRRPRQGFLVGRSIHSPEAARRAEAEGADYLVAGPVYETRSHPGREPAGLALIEQVTQIVRIPVLAIGGVTAGRAEVAVRPGDSWA